MEKYNQAPPKNMSTSISPAFGGLATAVQSRNNLPVGMTECLKSIAISKPILFAFLPSLITEKINEYGEKVFSKNWSAFHTKTKDYTNTRRFSS